MNKTKKIMIIKYLNKKFTALVGRDNGEYLLKQLQKNNINLDVLENKHDKIEIEIPDTIMTMNKSYFLGLFETRIQHLGKENFLNKYVFLTNSHILGNIPKYVDTALLKTTIKEILNA